MLQYLRAKEQYPDALLFFRLGDFYEMFYDDALKAAEYLGISQTFRGKGPEGEPIPMAGVPHHAAAGYITRLLKQGRKVAVCEQMADPKTVKGVVPREVVRVVTPGLCLEDDALDARSDNYLVVLHGGENNTVGLAAFELSTGELRATQLPDSAAALAEVVRLDPAELLLGDGVDVLGDELRAAFPNVATHALEDTTVDEGAIFEAILGDDQRLMAQLENAARRAAALGLDYAQKTQPGKAISVQRVGVYDPQAYLVLDEAAVRNLELVRTLSGEKSGSLLHHLDRTRTAMGGRMLRRRLLAPLTHVPSIHRRHDAVQAFVEDADGRGALRETLAGVGDLERLATKASLGLATPRDLGVVRDSLLAATRIAEQLGNASPALAALVPGDLCEQCSTKLTAELVDEPPVNHRDGGIVREGVDPDLDELRKLSSHSKDVILDLERRERERTGISSLKIKFTRVFGYYIEVTRSNLGLVPEDYIRKQTVANGERFVTEELAELQERILSADEGSKALEQKHFEGLRQAVAAEASRLRGLGAAIAAVDVGAALAEVAHRHDYVRPEVNATHDFRLVEARHPIVEGLVPSGAFVPNDVWLSGEAEPEKRGEATQLMVITGPNMSGKSTVMRQAALAAIMAQLGSFVPAREAVIGVVDRVYTRVGARDDLGEGLSTFMVEMKETAAILRGASRRSLVILDEIGRGTSTYDGLAIAWAVAEHLHDAIGCRAMFATHYHELTELAQTKPGAANYNVAAQEDGDDVVFLHKLVPGATGRSYGIAVARLAGVPGIVLARAKAILGDLEDGAALPGGGHARVRPLDESGSPQLELFVTLPANEVIKDSEVEKTLAALDVDRMTPVEALMTLSRLKGLLP